MYACVEPKSQVQELDAKLQPVFGIICFTKFTQPIFSANNIMLRTANIQAILRAD